MTVGFTKGCGVSSNRTFELVLRLPLSSIGRGEGLDGPASGSEPSSTPGKCRISSAEVCGDLANRLSVDVLSVRSDGARDGAAEAIGDRSGPRDGLVPLLLSRSDERLEEPFDRIGRASAVYAGEGPRSAIDKASNPGGGPNPGLSPL
jgi:hypothetical protein